MKHAKQESCFSSIMNAVMTILFLVIVVTTLISSFFGSWDQFVYKIIEEIPFGAFLFKSVAKLLEAGNQYPMVNIINITAVDVITDCIKLLIASILLSIGRIFTGYEYKARHAETPPPAQRIVDFLVDKIVLPVVAAILAAWIVTFLAGKIAALGGVLAVIVSTLATLAATAGGFWIIAAAGFGWSILRLSLKLVPSILSTLFSYCIVFLFVIILSSPEYIAALGPIMVIFLAILCLLSVIDGKIDGWFE